MQNSFLKRIILGFLYFSFLFIFNSLNAWPEADYTTFLKTGDQHYAKFENLQALKEYQKAYELAPNQYEPLMKLTRAYIDTGEDLNDKNSRVYYETAVEYAELLQKKFPQSAETYFLLSASYGNLALFRGGKEKVKLSRFVEQNAKKAIAMDPEYDLPYMVLGVYYREVANLNWLLKAFAKTFFGGLPPGTNEDSERTLLRAIQLKPTSIYAHYELGVTYEMMKNRKKALEYYRKAVSLPYIDHNDAYKAARAQERLTKLSK